MYKQLIEKDLKGIVQDLGFGVTDPLLSIPENSKFGDYSSNIPLQLAKQNISKNKQTSQEIANEIIEKFGHPPYLERVEVAGPGFLNFYLNDKALLKGLESHRVNESKSQSGKTGKIPKRILVEYSSPNAAKPYHIGHLRNITTGESISRILESQGNEIFRMTYNSDIGTAFAKVMWGVKQKTKEFEAAKDLDLREKANFLGKIYVEANTAYEDDSKAKAEIDELNKAVYAKDTEALALWNDIKGISAAYLDAVHSRFGTEFDAEVWESEVGDEGKRIVKEFVGKVFKEDDGAIIFPGSEYGLHNRVFINSAGNPTYEAKDIGLAIREMELYPFDQALHIVANEQTEYFKVIFKAIEMVEPMLLGKKKHLPYGFITLPEGKMSSRKGNVITAEQLVDMVKTQIKTDYPNQIANDLIIENIALAAVKFAFLKYSLNSDIILDIKKSVSLQGDSGPYLLYTYARIQSLLNRAKEMKANVDDIKLDPTIIAQSIRQAQDIEDNEREVLRQLEYFDTVVESAANKLQPNEIANYLLNLAKSFNSFYEFSPIIGSEKQDFRLVLITKVAETIKKGLYLLGIETVDRM